ncbi:hypothetical protein WJX84_006441 [Apatococcus fuscideae]|uniref:Uncharacterized protein n=1 Tax=Apatococcus fuscideae TaxID=2026836 RepID=A0AAW1TGI8_9CHLO
MITSKEHSSRRQTLLVMRDHNFIDILHMRAAYWPVLPGGTSSTSTRQPGTSGKPNPTMPRLPGSSGVRRC